MKLIASALAITGITILGFANFKSPLVGMTPSTGNVQVDTVSVPASVQSVIPSVSKKHVEHLTLTSENTVFLVGEVNENAQVLAQEINHRSASGSGPLYLYINSPGGSVLDGVQVVSAIQASKRPVVTICSSICASMAAIIFSIGTKRYMVDRSLLMFHEAAGGVQGQFNQMQSRLGVFSRLVDKLDYEIATRAGMEPALFKSKMGSELWLDGEDAVAQGFAEGLVNVQLDSSMLASMYPSDKAKVNPLKSLDDKIQVRMEMNRAK